LLDHLAGAGYAIGLRERIAAHRVLVAATVSDAASDDPAHRFSLLEPLLSRNHDEQQRFMPLVLDFVGQRERARSRRDITAIGADSAARRTRYGIYLSTAAVAIAVAMLSWWLLSERTPSVPRQNATTSAARAPEIEQAAARTPITSIYVPRGPFLDPASTTVSNGAAFPGLRRGLVVLEGLILTLLAASLLRWWRQDLYLQRLTTDQDLELHVLRAPPADVIPILSEAEVRPVSRLLRQRMTGARRAFDPRETLRATVRARVALSLPGTGTSARRRSTWS
jgi:hypothetical protein